MLLAHPLTRGMDLDDPRLTKLRRRIIQENEFLRRIYDEWYTELIETLPPGPGLVLEVGSGAGFLFKYVPNLITSDVALSGEYRVVLEAQHLPFADGTLRAILMTQVLHHLPSPRIFFKGAARCVRTGGVLAMIEPWVTRWSRFIYGKLHHEPFHPEVETWDFTVNGPLSGANSALTWVIFERDRSQFEDEFPEWRIDSTALSMPFRYLVSGGVSMRGLMPGWAFGIWRKLEDLLRPWMDKLAMFCKIVLVRDRIH
jgi:SAM-dependent methyltransferase